MPCPARTLTISRTVFRTEAGKVAYTFPIEKPVGILSMQGAIEEHEAIFKKMGVPTLRVKREKHLEQVSGIVFPGGESTAMIRLLKLSGLIAPLKYWISECSMPVLATCAGMILLSSGVDNFENQETLDLLNIRVKRNAFGRQIESFEEPLTIKGFSQAFRAVFIRAPVVTRVGDDIGILASHEDKIVMINRGNILAASFHPELTSDTRIHKLFLQRIERWVDSQNFRAQCS